MHHIAAYMNTYKLLYNAKENKRDLKTVAFTNNMYRAFEDVGELSRILFMMIY